MHFTTIIFPFLLLFLSACAPIIKAPPETMMAAHIKSLTQEQRAAMLARVEKEAKGFSVGAGSPNRAWVFFDPACSYCSDLWRETMLLKDQVEFVWIPVALLGDDGAMLGAATLDSADPSSLMSANEAAMRKSGTMLTVTAEPSEASVSTANSNTELLITLDPGYRPVSVPLMYYQSSSGQIEIIDGTMEARVLKAAMKLK
ncbi:hypothetical protein [Janthinobacterium sp. PSPC3-1]|uniref:hypothetical protein n=1 Tax=Janthinobacterium sp. PSPC3-1 TaxID=2804653 RepID=UPI003CE877EC